VATAFLDVVLRGTIVLMAPPRSISPGRSGPTWRVIDVDHAWHDALRYVGPAQDHAASLMMDTMSPC